MFVVLDTNHFAELVHDTAPGGRLKARFQAGNRQVFTTIIWRGVRTLREIVGDLRRRFCAVIVFGRIHAEVEERTFAGLVELEQPRWPQQDRRMRRIAPVVREVEGEFLARAFHRRGRGAQGRVDNGDGVSTKSTKGHERKALRNFSDSRGG